MDKVTGEICLDVYDFSKELYNKEQEVQDIIDLMAKPLMPDILDTVEEGKGGNKKLCMVCSYCEHKKFCFPEMRTFMSYKGPVFLAEVHKEPRMKEIL